MHQENGQVLAVLPRRQGRSQLEAILHQVQPTRLTLCRFDSGNLITETKLLRETQYICISHAWGEAFWRNISGIQEEVLASSEKAEFITKRLPSLVGTDWFWMDILAVNQRDKAARVAVTQHIPLIFRHAKRTIVVRNSAGLRYCCVQAIGTIDQENDLPRGQLDLQEHLLGDHLNDDGGIVQEALVERLWLLQEVSLSTTIQFVYCENVTPSQHSSTSAPTAYGDLVGPAFLNYIKGIVYEIFNRGCGWGNQREEKFDPMPFLKAFLYEGTVTRACPVTENVFLPIVEDFLHDIESIRETSHARDFILAILPKYGFYKVPAMAKQMTFGELFVDCFQQGEEADWSLAPLIQADRFIDDSGKDLPTANIPEPITLGDAAKLFLGARLHFCSCTTEKVEVELFSGSGNVRELLGIIAKNISISRHRFKLVQPEVVLTQDMGNRDSDLRIAVTVLNYLRQTNDGSLFDTYLPLVYAPNAVPCLVRLVAIISGGLGVRAYEWSVSNLTPVLVHFRGLSILALVQNSVGKAFADWKFQLTRSVDGACILRAWNKNTDPQLCSVGLLPQRLE